MQAEINAGQVTSAAEQRKAPPLLSCMTVATALTRAIAVEVLQRRVTDMRKGIESLPTDGFAWCNADHPVATVRARMRNQVDNLLALGSAMASAAEPWELDTWLQAAPEWLQTEIRFEINEAVGRIVAQGRGHAG